MTAKPATVTAARLQPDPTVDSLSQEVGVANVPGVFFDHVDQYLPQGHLPLVATPAYVGLGQIQVSLFIHEPLGERDLVASSWPRPLRQRSGRPRPR